MAPNNPPKPPRSPRQAAFDTMTTMAFWVVIFLNMLAIYWLGPAITLAKIAKAF